MLLFSFCHFKWQKQGKRLAKGCEKCPDCRLLSVLEDELLVSKVSKVLWHSKIMSHGVNYCLINMCCETGSLVKTQWMEGKYEEPFFFCFFLKWILYIPLVFCSDVVIKHPLFIAGAFFKLLKMLRWSCKSSCSWICTANASCLSFSSYCASAEMG